MWGASDLNLQVRTQSVNKPAEQLSVRLNVRVSECCRPHCWKPLSRQSTIFQHGARGFASGRRQQHNQTCYGRRRAEEYEDEKLYEDTYEQAVAPDEPISPPPQRSFPVFVAIPGIMLLAFTLFRIVKKIQGRGSVKGLVSRGLVQQEKGMNKGDPYYKDIMRHVNTMQMEELSEDQIAAARARRSKERDSPRFDIEKVDLPDNHPFAVKKKVSKDEEELAKKRLEVKRGLPLQDLKGNRGFPEDPRLAANQKLQAESQMLDEQAARAREARLARQAAAQQQQQQ